MADTPTPAPADEGAGAARPQPPAGPAGAPRINPRLLEILVCPVTKGSLDYDAQRQELVSHAAKLAFPIRDGIPIMLVDEARPLEG